MADVLIDLTKQLEDVDHVGDPSYVLGVMLIQQANNLEFQV